MPLADGERRKWDAMRDEVDFRMLAAGTPDGREFHLVGEPKVLAGPAYYAALPQRIARELRDFRPHAIVAQGAHETAASLAARRLARVRATVIADVHGDFRTPTRLYGSRLRSLLNPIADGLATAALRRADAVRTISDFTTGLVRDEGVEPADVFPAYVDLTVFLEDPPVPLPAAPRALFVGVLQRYKNIDGLVAAWRRVVELQPDARLLLVGEGRERALVERLVADLPQNVTWEKRLPQIGIKRALDESTLLLLPSRSEGLPRIVIEAFCRGRPVVGTRAGGIPDIVEDDVNGLLVERGDTPGLAQAIARVLTDRSLAERLAHGAHASSDLWTMSPEEFARRVRELVERAAGLS